MRAHWLWLPQATFFAGAPGMSAFLSRCSPCPGLLRNLQRWRGHPRLPAGGSAAANASVTVCAIGLLP